MGSREQELIRQLLKTFEDKLDARANLTLLVDTIYMLSGFSCSTFLLSRRDGQVWWDYMKGKEFKGNTLAALQPYQLSLDGDIDKFTRIDSGAYLKYFYPLDAENTILLRTKKQKDAVRTDLLFELVKLALPVIADLNARRQSERAVREDSCVRHLSDTLLSIKDRSHALELLAASISKCVFSERASVLAVSSNREMLTLKAVYGKVIRAGVASRPIRMGDGVAGWTLANRKTANIADVRHDPRFIVTTYDDIMSILCVPVCVSDEPVGVICAVNKRCADYDGVKPFPEDDESFLTAVSRNVSSIFQPA
jgi:putative methionine-R-sulfoxide reductase with GAF domain